MELRHLRYFVAVAEEQHITRAAERLGMRQPPLSQQIRQLEEEVGVALFTRVPRGVRLTAAGTAFLADARATLEHGEQAVQRARLFARGMTGRLVVGLTTSASVHPLVPQTLGGYSRAHPGVVLDVREANASELTEAVARGEVDAGFLRAVVAHPVGVSFVELLREPLVAVLPEGRVGGGATIRLKELRDDRFILVRRPAAPGMYAQVLQAARQAGFEPVVAAEVGRMLTAIGLVAAGLGVTVVPASMAALNHPGVRFAPLDPAVGLQAPLTLLHRSDEVRPLPAGFIAFATRPGRPRPASPP